MTVPICPVLFARGFASVVGRLAQPKDFVGIEPIFDVLVTAVTWQLANSELVPCVTSKGMENVRNLELADIALGAATIIVMFALLLVSMPGWH